MTSFGMTFAERASKGNIFPLHRHPSISKYALMLDDIRNMTVIIMLPTWPGRCSMRILVAISIPLIICYYNRLLNPISRGWKRRLQPRSSTCQQLPNKDGFVYWPSGQLIVLSLHQEDIMPW